MEEIVQQKRALLDPPSRQMHDAYSMALVQLLVDSTDGRHKLAQYLQDLPDAPNDPAADLRQHFPTVLGKASGRWWSLSVAKLVGRQSLRNSLGRRNGETARPAYDPHPHRTAAARNTITISRSFPRT